MNEQSEVQIRNLKKYKPLSLNAGRARSQRFGVIKYILVVCDISTVTTSQRAHRQTSYCLCRLSFSLNHGVVFPLEVLFCLLNLSRPLDHTLENTTGALSYAANPFHLHFISLFLHRSIHQLYSTKKNLHIHNESQQIYLIYYE